MQMKGQATNGTRRHADAHACTYTARDAAQAAAAFHDDLSCHQRQITEAQNCSATLNAYGVYENAWHTSDDACALADENFQVKRNVTARHLKDG